ncbi:hypothetical protein J2W30_006308 [Variovorax boronicumulans]|uniref:hypothetical protein n=1 Tax=Variovorax boronicumulans TaxID=436515 RepID=UPI0027844AB8|nr:hypothetical protein [Variovorax boronicumulans]MDQ0038521.1 hypothetical protein [Variovorax boronicumulans]
MKKELARQIGQEVDEMLNRFGATLQLVRDSCTEEEFKWYKSTVSPVMGALVLDVLNPLYKKYPEAKPEGYDD